ncbi:IS3 family transposase, partial [Bifidobacterium longum]|uniref:IS3 family transposase n=1 Tax=Bifidobacterium longum TaxID=216816 RepID=UPI00201E04BD
PPRITVQENGTTPNPQQLIEHKQTEQVFGHLKDEFYRGREFDSYERFKHELDAYIIHWDTRRRQIRLEGHIPEEFRSMSLAV